MRALGIPLQIILCTCLRRSRSLLPPLPPLSLIDVGYEPAGAQFRRPWYSTVAQLRRPRYSPDVGIPQTDEL